MRNGRRGWNRKRVLIDYVFLPLLLLPRARLHNESRSGSGGIHPDRGPRGPGEQRREGVGQREARAADLDREEDLVH